MYWKQKLTVLLSLITEAVRQAAEEPFPEVYTATGAVFSTNLRNFTDKITLDLFTLVRKKNQEQELYGNMI